MKALYLSGSEASISGSLAALSAQPVDQYFAAPEDWVPDVFETTIPRSFQVTGPGTYHKGVPSTLTFLPSNSGWKMDRLDLPEQLPIRVAAENVWTAKRSIVLRSGTPDNYQRMTEHIIAHRLGLGLDNVTVQTQTGDPPLFNVGSMPIAEELVKVPFAVDETRPLKYFTVKEPVVLPGPNGSFLAFEPAENYKLTLDVAIDFPTAIGKQHIVFDLFKESFLYGAHARTNCSRSEMLFALTIGKLFADIRNLGYNKENILVAGKSKYTNTPGLIHNGKSLEAVWHRACLDLVAALSLFHRGRLAGKITSYKAGHNLDCRFMTLLELRDLWQEMPAVSNTCPKR